MEPLWEKGATGDIVRGRVYGLAMRGDPGCDMVHPVELPELQLAGMFAGTCRRLRSLSRRRSPWARVSRREL